MSTKVDVASNDDCSGGILPGGVVSFYEPNGLSGCDEPRLVDTILSRPPARGLDGWDLVMAELIPVQLWFRRAEFTEDA